MELSSNLLLFSDFSGYALLQRVSNSEITLSACDIPREHTTMHRGGRSHLQREDVVSQQALLRAMCQRRRQNPLTRSGSFHLVYPGLLTAGQSSGQGQRSFSSITRPNSRGAAMSRR